MSVDVPDSHRFAQLRRNHSRWSEARTQRPRTESVQIKIAGVMGMKIKVPPFESATYTPRETPYADTRTDRSVQLAPLPALRNAGSMRRASVARQFGGPPSVKACGYGERPSA